LLGEAGWRVTLGFAVMEEQEAIDGSTGGRGRFSKKLFMFHI
jgi:hypothetical protein